MKGKYKIMKTVILTICAAVVTVFTGCKSIPSADAMYSTSYAIGYAAGAIANECKISDKDRNVVVDIVNIVTSCVPETNQTFEAAWTPIAQAHVDKLVAEGKISANEGVLIMGAFGVVVKSLDYIFEVRYPKAKQYKDLVVAAIDGASAGFLRVFKPANAALSVPSKPQYDIEAYNWLKKNALK